MAISLAERNALFDSGEFDLGERGAQRDIDLNPIVAHRKNFRHLHRIGMSLIVVNIKLALFDVAMRILAIMAIRGFQIDVFGLDFLRSIESPTAFETFTPPPFNPTGTPNRRHFRSRRAAVGAPDDFLHAIHAPSDVRLSTFDFRRPVR